MRSQLANLAFENSLNLFTKRQLTTLWLITQHAFLQSNLSSSPGDHDDEDQEVDFSVRFLENHHSHLFIEELRDRLMVVLRRTFTRSTCPTADHNAKDVCDIINPILKKGPCQESRPHTHARTQTRAQHSAISHSLAYPSLPWCTGRRAVPPRSSGPS